MGAGLASLAVLIFALFYSGWDLLTGTWYLWAFILAPFPLIVWAASGQVITAGADWVYLKKGRTVQWVRLYELTEVKVKINGVTYHLALKDSAGRNFDVRLAELQTRQKLWDLVYAGIVHSVRERDLDVGRITRNALKLPER
ncbi:MAG: hypothetical protein ACRDPT_06680 [Streptomycetales bacterium]